MDDNSQLLLGLIPALGMMGVGIAAVVWCRIASRAEWKWFFIGAALWIVAVAIKFAIALAVNPVVLLGLRPQVSHAAYVALGGLFIGIESSLCEMGITWLAVLIWRQLGKDSQRAVAVGVGAGGFEAGLLGLLALIAVLAALANLPGTEVIRQQFASAGTITALVWLVGPVERVIAVLCHASTRALILLGVTHRRPLMVIGGFTLFTLIDTVAGAAQISGALTKISVWWIELALLPCAIVSVPILMWCNAHWARTADASEAAAVV